MRIGLNPKSLFLSLGLFILLGALFCIYYYFFAAGNVVLTVSPPEAKIELGSEEYTLNQGNLSLKLKKGSYPLHIEASGYLAYDDTIFVSPSKSTRRIINMDKLFYLNDLNSKENPGDSQDVNFFPKFDSRNNRIIYYSSVSRGFFSFSVENETYLAANSIGEDLISDLGLTEGDEVYRVNYSPLGTAATVYYKMPGGDEKIKLTNFSSGKVIDFSQDIRSVDFLDENNIITVDDEYKVTSLNLNLSGKTVLDAGSNNYIAIFAFSQKAVILFDKENRLFLFDVSSKVLKNISIDGVVTRVIPTPDRKEMALLLVYKDELIVPYVVKADGSIAKHEIFLTKEDYIAWADNENVVFLDSQDTLGADFCKVSIIESNAENSSCKQKTRYNIDPNRVNGVIAGLGKIYFVYNSIMMGFDTKK